MTAADSSGGRMLAGLAVAIAAGLLLLGFAWYGISAEVYQRIWRDITDRVGGPMSFRFFLQPTMAAIAAFHDGVQDARLNRAPYFWTVLRDPLQRTDRLREGLISTGRIILLGLAMDAIYQWRVLKTFYPGEAVLMALLLAFIPYLLLRGLFARIARRWQGRSAPHGTSR